MGWNRRRAPFVLAVTVGSLFAASAGQAQPAECRRITAVPATISRPGSYCLVRDLATTLSSGAAITIAADDVLLDLQGFALDGSAAGAGSEAHGIRADGQRDV